MEQSVFISHSSKDRKMAETICLALETRGIKCWLASRDVKGGENFMQAIVRAIRTAKVMVLVFSSHANESNEIKKELALASQSRLVIIPVRTEDVLPDEALSYQFAIAQYIDLFNDWERQIERLTSTIADLLPASPEEAAKPKVEVEPAKPLTAAKVTSAASTERLPSLPTTAKNACLFLWRLVWRDRWTRLGAIIYVPFFLLYVVTLPFDFTTVPPGYAGVLWKRFSGPGIYCWCIIPSGTVLEPGEIRHEGLHFVWWWDKLFLYDLRLQSSTQKFDAATSDGVSFTAEIAFRYQVRFDSIGVLHQFIGQSYLDSVLVPEVGNVTRMVIAQYKAGEIATLRAKVQDEIRSRAENSLSEHLDSFFQADASVQEAPQRYENFLQHAIIIKGILIESLERSTHAPS